MGLRSEIQEALTAAFDSADELADVVTTFTLSRSIQGDAYDTELDETVDEEELHPSRGIFEAMPANEQPDTNAKFQLEKLIVNAVDLDIEPVIDDKLFDDRGNEYIVKKPNPVMGGANEPIIYQMIVVKSGARRVIAFILAEDGSFVLAEDGTRILADG